LNWLKNFGPAENILEPVEGQGSKFMPCPSTGPKIVCAGPNFFVSDQNLFRSCTVAKLFVPDGTRNSLSLDPRRPGPFFTPQFPEEYILSLLGLLQVANYFELVQIFCARPKLEKTYCAGHKHFVPHQESKFNFCASKKVFEEALMPCPFTGPKMFWAGPNFLCQTKNLFTYLWQSQTFCARQKVDLHSVNLVFVPAQNILGPVKGQGINAIKLLVLVKKFGQSQKFLEPVKGQGISVTPKIFVLPPNANHLLVWDGNSSENFGEDLEEPRSRGAEEPRSDKIYSSGN
jgi:hypothetical protein